jgi:hypothetical protein
MGRHRDVVPAHRAFPLEIVHAHESEAGQLDNDQLMTSGALRTLDGDARLRARTLL